MLDKYAIFSNHAKERLKECQLSMAKANWLLYSGTEEELPKDLRDNKKKYSDRALYIRNGTIIFTLIPTIDKYTDDEVYLIVSVNDQRIGGSVYGAKK